MGKLSDFVKVKYARIINVITSEGDSRFKQRPVGEHQVEIIWIFDRRPSPRSCGNKQASSVSHEVQNAGSVSTSPLSHWFSKEEDFNHTQSCSVGGSEVRWGFHYIWRAVRRSFDKPTFNVSLENLNWRIWVGSTGKIFCVSCLGDNDDSTIHGFSCGDQNIIDWITDGDYCGIHPKNHSLTRGSFFGEAGEPWGNGISPLSMFCGFRCH